MSQTSSPRKREILMRVATTRIDVLDAVASARRGAGDCMSALHLSGRTLGYGAAAIGGLLLARRILRPAGTKTAPVALKAPNPWTGVAVQAVSLLVLPLAHAYLTGNGKLPRMPKFSLSHVRLPQMPNLDPTYLFFRWLGLVK